MLSLHAVISQFELALVQHHMPNRTTLIIQISEGRENDIREISEGDTKFLYAMKLMSPNFFGSIVHPGIIH